MLRMVMHFWYCSYRGCRDAVWLLFAFLGQCPAIAQEQQLQVSIRTLVEDMRGP